MDAGWTQTARGGDTPVRRRSGPGRRNFCALGVVMLGLAAMAWAETGAFPEFKVETARDYLQAVAQQVRTRTGPQPEILMMEARLQSELGRHDEAERLARLAWERDAKRADAPSFLADLFIRQDRLEEASRCLRQALALDPKVEGGHRRLGMVLDRLGNRDGARKAFETGAQWAPDDATARLLLGRLLLDQGQIPEAVSHLEKACQLDPELASAFYALSQARSRQGDSEAARKLLDTFQQLKRREKTSLDAANAGYNNEKALLSLAAGFHDEAAAFFLQQQQDALAETHWRQAARLAPHDPRGYEGLGSFYLRKGQLAEARKICEDLVRLWPNQATYRVNLGTVLLQLKEYPAAAAELKHALELEPSQLEALNNLTRYYLAARRNLPEALELCRRLVARQPTAANDDLLAWALYANGRIDEARAASAEAVKKDPRNPVYQERLRRLKSLP